MRRKNRFGEYISKLRMAKGISLEQLSDGLCDVSLISRFERGEREPEKLLQNRFLTRLGVVPENYENFLYYKEYCRWEKRQGIIHSILDEHLEEAKHLLEEYYRKYDMNYSLERQFYLAMLAQIRRYEGADKDELAALFEQALQLTVPDIDSRSFRNRVLSLEELNLLLEYRYCRPKGISLQFYELMLDYIEKLEQTMLAMAKIYPKTVYYYYLTWKNSGEAAEKRAARMMELCDKAIELLRNANRMFYLWELFCMKEELVPKLKDGTYQAADYAASVEDCRNWRLTLEELYQEYGVTISMYEFCYLYVESENYCIGDVIRIRRKMLGISQEKLSKGICDSRTVSRLERNIRKPQKEIVQKLFDRLNLSTELCRTELVTDSQEAIEKYEEIKKQSNSGNYEKVEDLLEEMKQLISMDNASNMQSIKRDEYLNNFYQGKYSRREYIGKLKEVLGYTISFGSIVASKEKYLTNIEISCLQNILLMVDEKSTEMVECVDALIDLYSCFKFPAYYARMYEFIMITIASKLGNKGEFKCSNTILENVGNMSLKNRRMKALDRVIYGLLWNMKQEDETATLKYSELDKCIKLCSIAKKKEGQAFFENKIKQEEAKNKSASYS